MDTKFTPYGKRTNVCILGNNLHTKVQFTVNDNAVLSCGDDLCLSYWILEPQAGMGTY